MKKKRAYRAVSVQVVNRDEVKKRLASGGGSIGIDVSKETLVACLRYGDETFERPWKVRNTWELGELVGLLEELNEAERLPVGMESTGTYGDALRQAMTDAGLDVRRVSGKACADYSEVFDGVPSQHDGKDAAVLAELVAFGKSSPWPWRSLSEADQELEYWVSWMDIYQHQEQQWLGRLEGLLARYWPEATETLSLRTASLINVLATYGGPAAVAADRQARQQISRWGGPCLSAEKIEALLAGAAGTVGVRMTQAAQRQVQEYAGEVLRCRGKQREAEKKLAELASGNEVIQRQAQVVGLTTACVTWVMLGDVRDYPNSGAYRKAMGLNLKERSSGKYQGQLKLTKRGPSLLRRWLYFAALRACQRPAVKPWYEAKKTKENNRGGKGLIAIMRKLALVLYHVGMGTATYDERLLFPGEPIPQR